MAWNDFIERQKFVSQQKKMTVLYRKLGMSEEKIAELEQYDFEAYKSDRRFATNTRAFYPSDYYNDTELNDDNCKSKTKEKYIEPQIGANTISQNYSRYWWINEIENPQLAKILHSLSDSDIELLTLIVIDGYSQNEIAIRWGVDQSTISKKFLKIKKTFGKPS